MFEPYIDAFPRSVVCYHLHDELLDRGNGAEQNHLRLRRLLGRVDAVFVASQALYERYSPYGNVHLVPNGVDTEPYDAALARPRVPSELSRIPRPLLGYSGTLRAQIDVALLADIAGRRPDWSLVFVGDVTPGMAATHEFRRLESMENVYFVGPVPTTEVASYVTAFDVGLLCYETFGAARFCYPLKMLEYLAGGLPVVGSAIPAIAAFAPVIRIANSADDWVVQIDEALRDTTPEAIRERRTIARRNTWDERVTAIGREIHAQLQKRRPSHIRQPFLDRRDSCTDD